MTEHRLTEWFAESQAAGQGSVMAFVPCPGVVMQGYTPAQIAFVEDVYRKARELLEIQFRKPTRKQPAFSMN